MADFEKYLPVNMDVRLSLRPNGLEDAVMAFIRDLQQSRIQLTKEAIDRAMRTFAERASKWHVEDMQRAFIRRLFFALGENNFDVNLQRLPENSSDVEASRSS